MPFEEPFLNTSRRQWVLTDRCGCALGVLEGGHAPDRVAALREFFSDREERLVEFYEAGLSLRDVPHAEYQEKYRHQMLSDYQCPHKQPKPGFWRRLLNALEGKW